MSMNTDKVFTPILYDTLVGTLKDFASTLKGRMPESNVALIGMLRDYGVTLKGKVSDPNTTLIGVTDIFKYVERLDLGELSAWIGVSGDISELAVTTAYEIAAVLKLAGTLQEISLEKCLDDVSSDITLSGDVQPILNKSVVPESSAIAIGGSAEIESVRLRKLGDLAGLTLGDLSTWTMNELYYKEE